MIFNYFNSILNEETILSLYNNLLNIRELSGKEDGSAIDGNLSYIVSNGDISFNNSLQEGIKAYTTVELSSLLETELLKHSNVGSISDDQNNKVITADNFDTSILNISYTGGSLNDITIDNYYTLRVLPYTNNELATLIESLYIAQETIYSSSISNNLVFLSGNTNGESIGILNFSGSSASDITFSDIQTGIVNFTKSELAILIRDELIKSEFITSYTQVNSEKYRLFGKNDGDSFTITFTGGDINDIYIINEIDGQLTYTTSELASLQYQILKSYAVGSSENNGDEIILTGLENGKSIGNLSIIGGENDFSFNNSLQIGYFVPPNTLHFY